MAKGIATRSSRGHRTICVPISEELYPQIVSDPREFRRTLDERFREMPELFPKNFAAGYELKDGYVSVKLGVTIRRILLSDGVAYSVRPSFVMPYMTARTENVQVPLFFRKFGVPFWALAYAFGHSPMYWYRMECGLGRFSVVGTTVRQGELPEDLLADEHHQTLDGQKIYIATTVANGCCLGAEPAETAGTDDLKVAYEVFKDEARDIDSDYHPKTVNTDGWKGTQAAWSALSEDRHPLVLLAWLAQGPRTCQAFEGGVRGSFPASLGGVPRAGPPQFWATAPLAPPVGGQKPDGSRPGKCPEPVWQARPLVDRLSLSPRPSHQQHARPPDARNEPLLRPRPTSARRV